MGSRKLKSFLNHLVHVEDVQPVLLVQEFGLGLLACERISREANLEVEVVRVGRMLETRSLLVVDLDNLLKGVPEEIVVLHSVTN